MSDPSLFEELPLEGLNEEAISSFGAVYGEEALKGVQELLKDATPFKMSATVSISLSIPYVLGRCPSMNDLLFRPCR